VSRYHLHARALEGPLQAPRRDEVRVAAADDPDEAETWARRRVAEGFTVWVYDHGHPNRVSGACDYRLIAHYRRTGDAAVGAAPARIPRTPRPVRQAAPRDPAPVPHAQAVQQLRAAHRR
jgi:hypothetical protein